MSPCNQGERACGDRAVLDRWRLNKLLAKISSDLDKPDGLTMLAADDIARRIYAAATAQNQRHRTQGARSRRWACAPSASSPTPIPPADRAFRQEPRGGCTRRGQRTRRGRWRRSASPIDQPRDDCSSAISIPCAIARCRDIFTSFAGVVPTTFSARVTWAGRSAQDRYDDFRR